MMRPKPKRVIGCDPFKPVPVVHEEAWGARGDDDRHVYYAKPRQCGAAYHHPYFLQAQFYMIDDCEVV
jgi:hypothetical protein